MKFISKLDYYAIKPNLALGKNDAYHSSFGGLITLMIFSSILYIFIDFSRNMITKADPAIKTSFNFHDIEPTVDLKDLGLLMFLYDRSKNKYISDSTIAYFEAKIVKTTELEEGGFNEVSIGLEIEPCSIERFKPTYLHEYLKRLGITKSYCLKQDQNHEETISGGWGEPEYDYMNIELRRCSGTSPDGLPCKSKAEIDEVFKNAIAGVNIIDAVLHLEDYNNPHKKMVKSIHTFTSNQIHKEYIIDLSLGRINTDSGWLLESKTEEEFLKVTGEREMTKLISEAETGSVASFVIQMTNIEQVYDRTYDKLQDVFARAGRFRYIEECRKINSKYFE
jgi:hypothetical protein